MKLENGLNACISKQKYDDECYRAHYTEIVGTYVFTHNPNDQFSNAYIFMVIPFTSLPFNPLNAGSKVKPQPRTGAGTPQRLYRTPT